jgi:hypothetical protein
VLFWPRRFARLMEENCERSRRLERRRNALSTRHLKMVRQMTKSLDNMTRGNVAIRRLRLSAERSAGVANVRKMPELK